MKKHLLVSVVSAIVAGCSSADVNYLVPVVPQPADICVGKGSFRLSSRTAIRFDASDSAIFGPAADFLMDGITEYLAGAGKDSGGIISFSLSDALADEAYILDVRKDSISVVSSGASGAFYAVQSLLQMIPFSDYGCGEASVPVVRIEDAPDFAYRGFMLDVARHFFSVEEIKRTLDILAMHKMNVFHWHLTDDQGWRIEIRKYPELTRTGSVRARTIIGKDPGGEYDETVRYDERPYGGFYTQGQIREIVAYAAERHITVIPEIEFPGHAVAALASYPYLSCTGEQYEVRQTWDIDDRVFCIGKESTFRFLEDVLDEVMELFPSEMIHIGGDECPVKMWEKCPHCSRRMLNEGLAGFRELQGYATERIAKYLERHGRQLVGWDEILEANVGSSAVVMSWRGTESGIRAAANGNRVIMSPTTYSYFDYYQTPDAEDEPLAWGGCITLDKVYSFDPYEGLDDRQRELVLGVQANLWTEYVPDFGHAMYMMLPRLAAMSEVGWNHNHGDYVSFLDRLSHLIHIYDLKKIGYRRVAQCEE